MKPETNYVVKKYKDRLFAAAFAICQNAADAEDAVQETFIRYHTEKKEFDNEEHMRAWLLRVVINKAKNLRFAFWRRCTEPLEDYAETLRFETPEDRGLFDEVQKLPDKYRIVIHLFYYEDYSVREIAAILHISESNVKVRLNRARRMLKDKLKEAWDDDE